MPIFNRELPQQMRQTNPIIVHKGFRFKKNVSPCKVPVRFDFNLAYNNVKNYDQALTNNIENIDK